MWGSASFFSRAVRHAAAVLLGWMYTCCCWTPQGRVSRVGAGPTIALQMQVTKAADGRVGLVLAGANTVTQVSGAAAAAGVRVGDTVTVVNNVQCGGGFLLTRG